MNIISEMKQFFIDYGFFNKAILKQEHDKQVSENKDCLDLTYSYSKPRYFPDRPAANLAWFDITGKQTINNLYLMKNLLVTSWLLFLPGIIKSFCDTNNKLTTLNNSNLKPGITVPSKSTNIMALLLIISAGVLYKQSRYLDKQMRAHGGLYEIARKNYDIPSESERLAQRKHLYSKFKNI